MSGRGVPSLSELPAPPDGRTGWPWTETGSAVSPHLPDGRPWPRVTIVTPSYNQAQFLEEAMRSVLLQGYPDLEYIVLDGGSRDGSAEIIRRYASRLAYWASEPDGGQAAAINAGWRRATGEIVAYLNSDDLYLPRTIQRAVEFLAGDPGTGIVYGACRVVDEEGRILQAACEMPDCSVVSLLRCPLPQPTMFLRRSVLERTGFLDETLQCVMDWELAIRAALAGTKIARIAGPPVAACRVWPGTKTSTIFALSVDENLRVRDRLLADPALPRALLREVRLSKGWSCLWPAYQYYRRGETRAARRLLDRAVGISPAIARHREFLGLYFRVLLGWRGSRAARAFKARVMRWLAGSAVKTVVLRKKRRSAGWESTSASADAPAPVGREEN